MKSCEKELIWSFDIGTSSTKALALSLRGKVLGSSEHPHKLLYLDGDKVESNPEDWEISLLKCTQDLRKSSGAFPEALVIGGQGPTLVPLGKDLKPLGNAISWMDRRATTEAKEIGSEGQRFIDSSFYMPKALWYLRHSPLRDQVHLFIPCPEYLILRFTGKAVSGIPQKGFENFIWDRALMAKLGVKEDIWPELAPCGRIIGPVSREASERMGIPEGIQVVLGAPDFIESLLGTGTIKPGRACDRGGTSQGINLCVSGKKEIPGLITLPHIIQGYWNISGLISTTGKALEKVKGWLGWEKLSFEEVIQSASKVSPGSEGIIFIPHLAGERSPFWNPDTRGVFFGLGLNHNPEHLLRAVLEGIGFAIRQIMEVFQNNSLSIDEFRSTGKQAQSLEWTQIKADITNRPFLVPKIKESEPLGGGLLGAVALGWYSSLEEAVNDMVRIERVLTPNPNNQELYQRMFSIYKKLLESLRESFKDIQSWKMQYSEDMHAYG